MRCLSWHVSGTLLKLLRKLRDSPGRENTPVATIHAPLRVNSRVGKSHLYCIAAGAHGGDPGPYAVSPLLMTTRLAGNTSRKVDFNGA